MIIFFTAQGRHSWDQRVKRCKSTNIHLTRQDPNKKNAVKLLRLLVEKGSAALRNVFDMYHPPATLTESLLSYRSHLVNLRSLRSHHMNILFPRDGKNVRSTDFDITLLYLLLTNICNLHPPSSTRSWLQDPPLHDQSMEANVARIMYYHKEVTYRVKNAGYDDRTFRTLWNDISNTIVCLVPEAEAKDIHNLKRRTSVENYSYVSREVEEWEKQVKKFQEAKLKYLEIVTSLRQKDETSTTKRPRFFPFAKDSLNEDKSTLKFNDEEINEVQDAVDVTKNKRAKLESVPERLDKLEKEVQIYQTEVTQAVKSLQEESARDKTALVSDQVPAKHVQKQQNMLTKLARCEFKGDIERLAELHQEGTRRWLFDKLSRWFNDEEPGSRLMVLTARHGAGKSVFSAKVCHIYQASGQLAACHFCKFNYRDCRDPEFMLQSLATYLSKNVSGFEEKLIESLQRVHSKETLRDSYRVHLKDPLLALDQQDHMIIVIDGVDEIESDRKNELLDLIFEEFETLPKWIKVLVTSRPELLLQEKLVHLKPVEIKQENEDHINDIKRFLEKCVTGVRDHQRILDHIVGRCEGSFLYAYHIQSELLKNNSGHNTATSIKRLLPKLKGIRSEYKKYFQRFENELNRVSSRIEFCRILEVLVAALSPLPLGFLPEVLELPTGTSERKKFIRKVKESLSGHLVVDNNCVTFCHEGVINWLTSGEEHVYVVDIKSGHKHLARVSEKEMQKVSPGNPITGDQITKEMAYALNYGPMHKLLAD